MGTEQNEKLTTQQEEIWSFKRRSNQLSGTSPQPGACEMVVPPVAVVATCDKSLPPLTSLFMPKKNEMTLAQ